MTDQALLVWLINIGVCLLLGLIPGWMGKSKGYGFGCFYAFGAAFFIPAFIVAAAIRPRSECDAPASGGRWFRPGKGLSLAALLLFVCYVAVTAAELIVRGNLRAAPVQIQSSLIGSVLIQDAILAAFVLGLFSAARPSGSQGGAAAAAAGLTAFGVSSLTASLPAYLQGGNVGAGVSLTVTTALYTLAAALAILDQNRPVALVACILGIVFACFMPLQTLLSAGVFRITGRFLWAILRNGVLIKSAVIILGLIAVIRGLPPKGERAQQPIPGEETFRTE